MGRNLFRDSCIGVRKQFRTLCSARLHIPSLRCIILSVSCILGNCKGVGRSSKSYIGREGNVVIGIIKRLLVVFAEQNVSWVLALISSRDIQATRPIVRQDSGQGRFIKSLYNSFIARYAVSICKSSAVDLYANDKDFLRSRRCAVFGTGVYRGHATHETPFSPFMGSVRFDMPFTRPLECCIGCDVDFVPKI